MSRGRLCDPYFTADQDEHIFWIVLDHSSPSGHSCQGKPKPIPLRYISARLPIADDLWKMLQRECGFAAPDTRAGMYNGSDRCAHRIVLSQSFRLIPSLLKSVEHSLISDYIHLTENFQSQLKRALATVQTCSIFHHQSSQTTTTTTTTTKQEYHQAY